MMGESRANGLCETPVKEIMDQRVPVRPCVRSDSVTRGQ